EQIQYLKLNLNFVYLKGKPMTHYLHCCQGFAVAYYSFNLERLEYSAPSAFANLVVPLKVNYFFESVKSKYL
nr:hypothetical protein [Desulfobacterales bacterium]